LQEVGASKEHITRRFPVPTIEAPVVGCAVTASISLSASGDNLENMPDTGTPQKQLPE